jgi:lipopolysaccharide/colanic/teichoic acid biosynthesis glycosyltransferase
MRAGLNGTPFRLYKFRTMVAGAEESLSEVVSLDELPDPMFKLRRDPRITRVGRVLRRLSVDELPQLINVVRGDMSIVGPRPEQIELVERYRPEHRFRLQVKPGMTGPMQVFGRGELILAQTFPVVLRGTGAY